MSFQDLTPEQQQAPGYGVHIRSTTEHHVDDESIARLIVYVYPLPAGEVVEQLGSVLQAAAAKWLTEQKLVSGNVTDMTGKGTVQ